MDTMTRKDIQRLENIALEALKKGFTKEEALFSLMHAGIFDKNAKFTKPYRNLGRYCERNRRK
jgi:hypothetical protein